MMRVDLTVNGRAVSAEVEPRQHLADFLRDTLLLTGTHLGCEQGVCGACTVLLNEEPVRACITYAALCEGSSVLSIESLDDDPITAALRDAFTAEHALQCGYCTPGMLVTARDIVRRLPSADDNRIRLELAGNLCRCTGYNGIVRAIRRVLDTMPASVKATPQPVPQAAPLGAVLTRQPVTAPEATSGDGVHQTMRIGLTPDRVWAALQDPALVAGCVPGAALTAIDGNRIQGEMRTSLGPIQARFVGQATLQFDPLSRTGCVTGEGRDAGGGTWLSGSAGFAVVADGPAASLIRLDIAYSLRGTLAQLGRGPVVQALAAEIAATVARNLEARLRGETVQAVAGRLQVVSLLRRTLWRMIHRWLRI